MLALRIRNVKVVTLHGLIANLFDIVYDMQIEVLNDSKEIAATIYLTSAILAVVIIVSVVLEKNLTIYGAAYAYGTALSTTAVLVIVFFTKVHV